MASPYSAELLRLFVRESGEKIAQDSIPAYAEFDVVIQAEVGTTIFNNGLMYKWLVVVRDLTDGTTITTFNHRGSFGDMNWPVQDVEHPFHLNPQGVAKQDHVYQAIAVMVVGVGREADVDFQESDLFIIT